MQKVLLNLFILTALIFISCGDDDEGTVENLAPQIENQTFDASETVDDQTVIGTVAASDPEEDDLSFSMSTNSDNLFEISIEGMITLADGKQLDFETSSSHDIIIAVSDAENSSEATITINVIDENENVAPTISDQSFEVQDDISDSEIIGTVQASDTNGDALTFSISDDSDDLFEISATGELSLQGSKNLDSEQKLVHTITIEVSDGEISSQAEITINVVEANVAPIISDQSFEAAEDIGTSTIIGEIDRKSVV